MMKSSQSSSIKFNLKVLLGEENLDDTVIETTSIHRPPLALAGYVENYKSSFTDNVSFNAPDNYLCILFSDKNLKITSTDSAGGTVVFKGNAANDNFSAFTPIYIIRRDTSLTIRELGTQGKTAEIPITEKIRISPVTSYATIRTNIQFIPYDV